VTATVLAKTAQTAYGAQSHTIRTDRAVEYDAFSRVTGRLSAAARREDDDAFRDLCAALHDNRRLWTVIALDVAGDGNGLPDELRARLLYLARFTDQHTTKVMARQADPTVLIDINTAVMRGLAGQGGAA
jgi:flagellar protein FlaF